MCREEVLLGITCWPVGSCPHAHDQTNSILEEESPGKQEEQRRKQLHKSLLFFIADFSSWKLFAHEWKIANTLIVSCHKTREFIPFFPSERWKGNVLADYQATHFLKNVLDYYVRVVPLKMGLFHELFSTFHEYIFTSSSKISLELFFRFGEFPSDQINIVRIKIW